MNSSSWLVISDTKWEQLSQALRWAGKLNSHQCQDPFSFSLPLLSQNCKIIIWLLWLVQEQAVIFFISFPVCVSSISPLTLFIAFSVYSIFPLTLTFSLCVCPSSPLSLSLSLYVCVSHLPSHYLYPFLWLCVTHLPSLSLSLYVCVPHPPFHLPSLLVLPEVSTETLLTPGTLHRVWDGRKSRHWAEQTRVLQRNDQSTMTAHAEIDDIWTLITLKWLTGHLTWQEVKSQSVHDWTRYLVSKTQFKGSNLHE